ncbi:unnamed protein product [Ilex paraguariensis]|uniref:Conserved oligomeric Golgi complex subunit 4 N-terminal domain-containing protein n=1 Tax=Ilex paraguariensis TaxID=185542 RepID=A0ABC8TEW8_9AQUA
MTCLHHKFIACQRALDFELDTILSQRPDLDKQLSNLHKSRKLLEIVKADSDHMLSNVRSTYNLADQVSGKFRQLDLAQSCVNDTLLCIDAIVERDLPPDHAKYRDSGLDQRELLLASKKQLQGIVRKRLSIAVDQLDHPVILRVIRLYSPLGLEEEGLQVYISYLKKVILMRSRLEFKQLVESME